MKFCIDVYGPQAKNQVDSGDPLTFPPVPQQVKFSLLQA